MIVTATVVALLIALVHADDSANKLGAKVNPRANPGRRHTDVLIRSNSSSLSLSKGSPTSFDYNLNKDYQTSIISGTNISATTGHQMSVQVITVKVNHFVDIGL